MPTTINSTLNSSHAPSVKELTGARCTLELSRFINPSNPNEVIIHHKNIAIVVDREVWNMTSLQAKAKEIKSFSEVREELNR